MWTIPVLFDGLQLGYEYKNIVLNFYSEYFPNTYKKGHIVDIGRNFVDDWWHTPKLWLNCSLRSHLNIIKYNIAPYIQCKVAVSFEFFYWFGKRNPGSMLIPRGTFILESRVLFLVLCRHPSVFEQCHHSEIELHTVDTKNIIQNTVFYLIILVWLL